MRAKLLLAAALSAACAVASAQSSVFRCTGADGRTTYQAEACDRTARQGEVALPAFPPPPPPRPSAWKGYTPPKEAFFGFYYDPADEPVGYSGEAMEAAIRAAAQTWTDGCRVRIAYVGRAPTRLPGTPERVPVRWEPQYMQAVHSAGNVGIAGTGSIAAGIQLKPRFRASDMQAVLVHEMGHVLGLVHRHDEVDSVMSYLGDEATRRRAQPNEADFLACNLSMKKMFGVDFQPPAGVAPPRARMSDREAIERLRAKREAQPAPTGDHR